MRRNIGLLIVLLGGSCAFGQGAAETEVGAVAPLGTWTVEGGSLARTGCAASRPLAGALDSAWQVDLPGTVESEPLVWGDHVLVSVAAKPGIRELHSLRLSDGKRIRSPRPFKTDHELDPSIWSDLVLVRSGASAVELLRCGAQFTTIWKQDTTGAVQSLVVHEGMLFVLSSQELFALDIRTRKEAWKVKRRFRGTLALRGSFLHAVSYDDEGLATLHAFDRERGTLATSVKIGHHQGAVPGETAGPTIVVLEKEIYVHHTLPVPTADGEKLSTSHVLRERAGENLVTQGLVDAVVPITEARPWIGFLGADAPNLVAPLANSDQMFVLADSLDHAEYVAKPIPLSRTGDVVYAGQRSFRLDKRTVLWEGSVTPLFRAVPVRETVLLVTAPRRVEAFRLASAKAGAAGAKSAAAFTANADVNKKATAYLEDGSTIQGDLQIDGNGGKLVQGKAAHRLDQVLAVFDPDGKLLFASDQERLLLALELAGQRIMATELLALAEAARRAHANDLADDFLARAQREGAAEKEVDRIAKLIEAARKVKKPEDAAAVATIKNQSAALSALRAKPYWSTHESLPKERVTLRSPLLKQVITLDPAHAGARQLLLSALPKEFAGLVDQNLEGSLMLAESFAQSEIRLVEPPTPEQKQTTHAQRQLGSLQQTWRKDLIALESGQLLIVTPLAAPGSLARCLSMGELICDSLEKLFASGTKKRDSRYPLQLRVYETQAEYLKESTRTIAGFGAQSTDSLEWTSGHYSPLENVSRVFLPASEDAFVSVMNTYAHELTHHWIPERCPLFTTADRTMKAFQVPGYWVVEGFATFIEEGRFDLVERSFDPWNPRAESLDTVVNATRLLPWDKVLGDDQGDFSKIDPKPRHKIPFRWRLGMQKLLSDKSLFYAQAAATCHYLYHAEDGRLRPRLLDFIGLHYTAKSTATSVRDLFGDDPEALSKKVVDWARKTLGP